jgi:hypothetical protein
VGKIILPVDNLPPCSPWLLQHRKENNGYLSSKNVEHSLVTSNKKLFEEEVFTRLERSGVGVHLSRYVFPDPSFLCFIKVTLIRRLLDALIRAVLDAAHSDLRRFQAFDSNLRSHLRKCKNSYAYWYPA